MKKDGIILIINNDDNLGAKAYLSGCFLLDRVVFFLFFIHCGLVLIQNE